MDEVMPPGFTTLSDGEEESSNVISLKNDKTSKGQRKPAGTKMNVDQIKAVSYGANRKIKTSTKVITQKVVETKSIDKRSGKITKKAAKGVSVKPQASETFRKKKAGPKKGAPEKTYS